MGIFEKARKKEGWRMKFNTPRSPCLSGGFPLLEKGGDLPWRGGGYLGSWCLPYAPLGASLANGHGLVFLVMIHHATVYRKPTTAAKAFCRIVNVKLNKLFGYVIPSNNHSFFNSCPCGICPLVSCLQSTFQS